MLRLFAISRATPALKNAVRSDLSVRFEREQSPYCPSYRLRRFRACVQTLLTPWLYQARVNFAIQESCSSLRLKGTPVARSNAILVRLQMQIRQRRLRRLIVRGHRSQWRVAD